ncbi:MAG: hypothetical protein ABSH22_09465, partial [Tepidisphaeraceae bacterium]
MIDLKTTIGNPDIFPILEHYDFFNHAGVSPLPKPSADAFVEYAKQVATLAYVNSRWPARIDETR